MKWSNNHSPASPSGALIRLEHVVKRFPVSDKEITVLHDITLEVHAGEFVSVVGPSGNGKSTLLNMITGIDRPSEGTVRVAHHPVHEMSEGQLATWRGQYVGVIFQFFQMLPGLSLLHNVMLPMDFVRKYPPKTRKERAMHLLDLVDLADQAHKLPGMVSGGQQQRAAIARALANDPPLIIADEPTGNLDTHTAEKVFSLFEAAITQGKTMLMVTHNHELAERTPRQVEIRDGHIVKDSLAAETAVAGGNNGRHSA